MTARTFLRAFVLLVLAGAVAASQVPLAGAAPVPFTVPQAEDDGGWPRQIDDERGTIVIYQPEVEQFQGNTLSGRAAVSVTMRDDGATPVFGAVWMDARIETDRESRMVEILDVTVTNVRFPEATPEQGQELIDILEEEIPRWQLVISMDRLVASLDVAERERESANLRMAPPTIMVVDYPAVLISIDGEPLTQPADEDGRYMRVVNTAFTIVQDTGTETYYLYAGEDAWYASSDVASGWQVTRNVPSGVEALTPPPPDVEGLDEAEEEAETPEAIPQIIIATEATELIVTDGAPEYSPILGTELLYVTNSESDIVMEVATQRHFVILSGRWYASPSLQGPWEHIAPGDLPDDFGKIPPESDMGHLLVSVPDTLESNEAVLDQQVPQTAAIDRSATLNVEYDGDPEFAAIEGTSMEYALNTGTQVLRAEGRYYAVDEGVWFVSDTPEGPYAVATTRPAEVDSIPAENPHYNVKYVYVYDVQPEVVYVGYTPGYTYSYVYGGTVIYGTGYYYAPWYRTVYYPRPPTWGFHVRYNPWYGWGFGFSYSTGRFTFSIGRGGWGGRGWWGRPYYGYRRGYHRGWHRGYRAGARAGYRAGRHTAARSNMYRSQNNRARVSNQPARANRPTATTAPNRANNVYSDRSGNVYRQNQSGNWQQRSGNNWENRQPSTQNRSQLERSSQSRSRGTTRTQSSRSSRPTRSGGRGRGRG